MRPNGKGILTPSFPQSCVYPYLNLTGLTHPILTAVARGVCFQRRIYLFLYLARVPVALVAIILTDAQENKDKSTRRVY